MSNKNVFILVVVILVFGVIGLVFIQSNSTPPGPGKYDAFATCLKDKGAVFYGAWWCGHCKEQKELFGSSAKYLPYIECSTADGSSQLQACKDNNIGGYPTWKLADGTIVPNENSAGVTLETLAAKTSCALPQ